MSNSMGSFIDSRFPHLYFTRVSWWWLWVLPDVDRRAWYLTGLSWNRGHLPWVVVSYQGSLTQFSHKAFVEFIAAISRVSF